MHIKRFAIIFIFIILFINFLSVSFAYENISDWTSSTSLPYQIASHTSFNVLNKIYVIGGSHTSGASHSEVLGTEINTIGNITGWNTINALNTKLIWHSVANNQDFAYVLGGYVDNIDNITEIVRDVFFTRIDSNGNIENWKNTVSLPEPLALGNALIYKDKLYFAGGSINNNKIYFANINPIDGTLDSWTALSTTLPTNGARTGFGMIEYNGFLYIIGGQNSSEIILNSVQRAQFLADGTIDSWVQMPNLPQKVTRSGVTRVDNILISVGGITTSDMIDDVFFAKLNSDGSTSEWNTSTNKLIRKNCCSPLVSWNNHLFLIGGHDGTVPGYYNDVFTAKLINEDPQYISLDVPDLKQYEGGWENDLYGHTKDTISDFGCALTSASMVLKFFGHDIDPGELNNWLKKQKDGYLRNNLVNWLAVSRYTIIHESTTSPVLEYSRSLLTIDKILSNLQEKLPTIVKVPGHFVVTKSQTETSYGINDPGYSDRNELSTFYPDIDIKSLNTYTPSQTDLSYMMFVGDENLKFELFDSLGNPIDITKIQTFLEEPINELGGSDTSGEPLSILLFQKPQDNKYKLEVTGPEGKYQLDSYLYDLDGNVIYQNLNGYFFDEGKDIYKINYNQDNKTFVPYSEIYKKLEMARKRNLISNKKIYMAIRAQVIASEKLANRNKFFPSNIILRSLIRQIQNLTPKFINREFSLSLQSDLKSLIF